MKAKPKVRLALAKKSGLGSDGAPLAQPRRGGALLCLAYASTFSFGNPGNVEPSQGRVSCSALASSCYDRKTPRQRSRQTIDAPARLNTYRGILQQTQLAERPCCLFSFAVAIFLQPCLRRPGSPIPPATPRARISGIGQYKQVRVLRVA